MKRILSVCMLILILLLGGCNNEEKTVSPLTKEEKERIETTLTDSYVELFSDESVTVSVSPFSIAEIESSGKRGEITVFIPMNIGSFDDAKSIGENCSTAFDGFAEEHGIKDFDIEFYLGGQYRYENGVLYTIG